MEVTALDTVKPAYLSRLRELDWDFVGRYSESSFSATHWHPGRFASQIPAALIGSLSSPGDLVLDPFVGSGTTLVEAQRLGRRSLGLDINPVSVLVARAKVLTLRQTELTRVFESLRDDARCKLNRSDGSNLHATLPPSVQARKWYSDRVAGDLTVLWDLVRALEGASGLLATFAFSAILLGVCREDRHWGYVCDNTTPKSSRSPSVLSAFLAVLDSLDRAYQERERDIQGRELVDSTVECGDSEELLRELPGESVDLVVTSPPYFGVCDYSKAQRLTHEWLGLDLEAYRLKEIGARSKRRRRTAKAEYLNNIVTVLRELLRVLRGDGHICLVVGESAKREAVVDELREEFERLGVEVLMDIDRSVSSQRRQTPSIVGERVWIARKA